MMPFAFNLTLMNSKSMYSTIEKHEVALEQKGANGNSEELDQLRECVTLDLHYPESVWPFFGNVQFRISTSDSKACQEMEGSNLEFKVQVGLKNHITDDEEIQWTSFLF